MSDNGMFTASDARNMRQKAIEQSRRDFLLHLYDDIRNRATSGGSSLYIYPNAFCSADVKSAVTDPEVFGEDSFVRKMVVDSLTENGFKVEIGEAKGFPRKLEMTVTWEE